MIRGVALVVVATATGALAAPRAGKVVRIERPRTARVVNPRLCEVNPDGTGACLGPVRAGDVIVIVSIDAVIGSVRITEATSMPHCDAVWTIKGLFLSPVGNLRIGKTIGVVDGDVDRDRGRLLLDPSLTPSPTSQDQVMFAVDRDGDGKADIVMTAGKCDSLGNSGSGNEQCVDLWVDTAGNPRRLWHANVMSCN